MHRVVRGGGPDWVGEAGSHPRDYIDDLEGPGQFRVAPEVAWVSKQRVAGSLGLQLSPARCARSSMMPKDGAARSANDCPPVVAKFWA